MGLFGLSSACLFVCFYITFTGWKHALISGLHDNQCNNGNTSQAVKGENRESDNQVDEC